MKIIGFVRVLPITYGSGHTFNKKVPTKLVTCPGEVKIGVASSVVFGNRHTEAQKILVRLWGEQIGRNK